jgi:hypothetical protein
LSRVASTFFWDPFPEGNETTSPEKAGEVVWKIDLLWVAQSASKALF